VPRRSSRRRRGATLITHAVAEAVFLADRVYVMTPRPGAIAGVLEIDLPRPRTTLLAEPPQFGAHQARLRELLRERQDKPS
jgi:NitT/TauT family transport system ATP-binding protein